MVLWCCPHDCIYQTHRTVCTPWRTNCTECKVKNRERKRNIYQDGGKIQDGIQKVTSESVLQTNDITTFKWMRENRSDPKFGPS